MDSNNNNNNNNNIWVQLLLNHFQSGTGHHDVWWAQCEARDRDVVRSDNSRAPRVFISLRMESHLRHPSHSTPSCPPFSVARQAGLSCLFRSTTNRPLAGRRRPLITGDRATKAPASVRGSGAWRMCPRGTCLVVRPTARSFATTLTPPQWIGPRRRDRLGHYIRPVTPSAVPSLPPPYWLGLLQPSFATFPRDNSDVGASLVATAKALLLSRS